MINLESTHQTQMPLWDSRRPFSKPPGPPRERPPKARATSSRKTLTAKTEDFGALFSWHQSMPIKLVVQMQFQGFSRPKNIQVHQLGMVPICPNRLGICELVFSGCSIWWLRSDPGPLQKPRFCRYPAYFWSIFQGYVRGYTPKNVALYGTVPLWLVVLTILKNMSSSMGRMSSSMGRMTTHIWNGK